MRFWAKSTTQSSGLVMHNDSYSALSANIRCNGTSQEVGTPRTITTPGSKPQNYSTWLDVSLIGGGYAPRAPSSLWRYAYRACTPFLWSCSGAEGAAQGRSRGQGHRLFFAARLRWHHSAPLSATSPGQVAALRCSYSSAKSVQLPSFPPGRTPIRSSVWWPSVEAREAKSAGHNTVAKAQNTNTVIDRDLVRSSPKS